MTLVYTTLMLLRRCTSVALLVAAEIGALVLLHRLGSYEAIAVDWGDLSDWLARARPEDALVAVVRLVALALAWWLTASTVLYVLARASHLPRLIRSVRWATIAPVRKMVDGMLATTIVAASTFGSAGVAGAESDPRIPLVVQLEQPEGRSDGMTDLDYRPRPAGDPASSVYRPRPAGGPVAPKPPSVEHADPSVTVTRSAAEAADPSAQTSPSTHVVQPGDNLWRIAEQQLAKATSRPPNELRPGDIHAFWVRLVESNRHRLRSDDPNLIHLGEQIDLPEVFSRQ